MKTKMAVIGLLAFLASPAHAGGAENEGWLDDWWNSLVKQVSDWDWWGDWPGPVFGPYPEDEGDPERPDDTPEGGDEDEE